MANRNFPNSRIWTGHVMPVLLDMNFIVDPANGNGLGLRSLKGPFVGSVFMHTTATPAVGNPNPEAGIILVSFPDSYNRYFGGFDGFVSPLTGSPLTATTSGSPFVITALGTATVAQWQAVGFPVGPNPAMPIQPALGMSFVATASATIGGGATVSAVGVAGIDHIEVVGDPNLAIANKMPIVLQCLAAGVLTAPATGSVIGLSFYLSNSGVLVQGE